MEKRFTITTLNFTAFKWERVLPFVFLLLFLVNSHKVRSQCPVATATPLNQTICSGTTNNARITLGSDLGVTTSFTYSMTQTFANVTDHTGGSLAAPGDIVQSITTNPLTVVGTVTYTITPTDGACTGAPIVATITINPKPKVVSNYLGNVHTICSGNPTGVTLNSTFAGTLLTWTVSNEANTRNATPGSATDFTSLSDILYSDALPGGGITTYNIVPTANGCTGLAIDFDVTVDQTPIVSFLDAFGSPIGDSQTICSGNLTDLVVLDSDMPGNTYYTWESEPNLPSLSGYDTVGVFSDLHTNMYGFPPSQGEEMDTIPVQFISNSSSTSKTVTYSITVNGCPGPVTEYKITVDPSPKLLTIPFLQTICSGSSSAQFDLTSDLDPDVTYSWASFVLNSSPGAGVLSGRSPISDPTPTFAIPSQTLTTTSTTPDTVIYNITLTSTVAPFCSSIHQRWIIVKPLPNVISTPATSDTICSDSTAFFALSSSVANVVFDWTVDARGFAMGARDSTHVFFDPNDTIQQTLTNTAFIADTAVYTIVATSADGCTGLPYLDSVFVDPTPDVTTPPTASVCSDSTTLIELESNVAGTTFMWSVTQGAGISGAFNDSNDTIQQTLSNSGTTPGDVMYTIFPMANGCPGLPYVITVTVEPTPNVVATNAADTICSDSTTLVVLTSAVAGTTYSWTVTQSAFVSGAFNDSNDSIQQVLTNADDTVGFAVYTITPFINGCPGLPIVDSIYVNPTPVVTSTVTSQTICSDSTTSIPLQSPVAGTTFSWTVSESVAMGASAGGGNDTIQQTLNNPTTTAQTATYTVVPTAGGCPGAPFTVTVTVNPTPDVNGSHSTICSGDATNIVLSSLVAGTSYIWTVDEVGVIGASAGFGASPITQTLTATGTVAGTATYSIIPTAGGCPGLPIIIFVTVKPAPVVTATPSPDTICSNTATNIVLTSNLAGTTTYAWSATEVDATGSSGGTGSPITQTLTATGFVAGTVTYTIIPTNNGCAGAPVMDTVTVTPIPDVIATPASETICSGGTTGIALTSNVAGTTYTWTVDQVGVSGASASAGSAITQTLTTTGATDGTATYTVTPSVGGCPGPPITVVITVKPVSVATPAASTICSGDSPNTVLTSPIPGTTFDWTQVANLVTGARDSTNVPNNGVIDQVLTAFTTSVGTVVYTVTPLATGCAGLPVLVTITVNPVADVIPSSTATSICSGIATGISLSSSVFGTIFDWSVVQTDVSGASSASNSSGPITQTLTATGVVAGTAVYSITPEVDGCPGTVVTSTVTVYPVTTATPANPTICTGTAPNVTLVSPVLGTTFDWTVSQNGVSGAYDTINSDFIDQVLTLTGASSGTVDFTVTPSASGCAGTPIVVTVTVDPIEDPSFNYSQSTFCPAGVATTPLITGLSGGTFKASPVGLVFISTTTGEIDLSASALNTYTVTYTTPGICADSATFKITISNPPSAAFSYDQASYCKNDANPTAAFFPFSSAGVFTATPSGLVFANQFTGEIDLIASAAGSYTVTNTITCVTNLNASNSLTILPLDDATFNYSHSTFCKTGADPTPTTNIGGGTFSAAPAGLVFISTSTGEIDLSASALNTYVVTYTTPGPCVNTGTFGVTISNPPLATFSYPVAYCQNSTPNPTPTFPLGASAGVFTSQAGLVFANEFIGEIDLTASIPGTYTLTNTIPNCAGGVDFVATNTVTINAMDDASFNYSSSTFCQTGPDPTPLFIATAGGTFSASSPSLVFISTASGQIDLGASVLNVGAPYTITYTTNGVCPASATFGITITNTSPPGAAFSYAGPYCTNVTDPTPTYPPGSNSGGVFTAPAGLVFANRFTGLIDLSASTAGTYTVTNTIDCDGTLITATNTVILLAADDASFNYAYSTFCQSGTDPTAFISGLGGGVFSASSPNLVFLSTATGKIDLSASTVGTYTVTYTNVGGTCPSSETFVVNITSLPSPDADFSYASPYCQSSTPDASPTFAPGSFPGVFTSTPGLVFSDPFTGLVDLTASAQGTYTVTNTYDCSGVIIVATNTLTITMFPSFTVPANAAACAGDSISTTSFVNIPTYTWVNSNPAIGLAASGAGNVPAFETTNSTASTISGVVTVTSTLNGCVGSVSSYTVTVEPEVSADAGTPVSVMSGASVTLGGSPTGTVGSTYAWAPAADFTDATYANPIAKPSTTTLYSVIVTSGGCTATDSVLITVVPSFTPPGGFTPNGDGVNDTWVIDFLDFYPNNMVEIYNRWGELIFESPGYTEKWNGMFKGKELPVGTYYYIITLNDPNFPDAYTGPVTIMR